MKHVWTCSLSQWVGVCFLTHTNIQMLLAVLKADNFNPFTDHKSLWNISHRSLVREDATTINRKRLGSVCLYEWTVSPLELHFTQLLSIWLGSLQRTFFFSLVSFIFTVVFIGYSRTYMHAGSWNNRRGSQRCCLRQALAVRDTSICLHTHTHTHRRVTLQPKISWTHIKHYVMRTSMK